MSRSTYQVERDDEFLDDYDDSRGGGYDRMSFSRMVDDAARSIGGSEVIANLGAQARANPVPLVLVGIGLAWLMSGRSMGLSFGSSSRGYDDYDYGDDDFRRSRQTSRRGGSQAWNERNGEATWVADDSEEGGSWVDAAGNVLESAMSGVTSAASAVRDSVTGGARYVARTARHGGETVYSGASRFGSTAYDRASGLGSSAYESASYLGSRTRSTFSDLLDEEPLVLGAIGVAVGAAVGAMLPSTETENRYVGRYRDQLREEAERYAREQFKRGKAAASEGLRAAKEEAEAQGLSSSGMHEVADRARDAARDIAQAAVDGAKSGASQSGGSSGGTSSGGTGTGGSI